MKGHYPAMSAQIAPIHQYAQFPIADNRSASAMQMAKQGGLLSEYVQYKSIYWYL